MKALWCFAIGPLLLPVVLASVAVIGGDWPAAFGLVKLGLLLTYPIALLFALPAHLVLRKLRWRSAVPYAAAGFVLGALMPGIIEYAIYYLVPAARDYYVPQFGISYAATPAGVLFGLIGLSIALIFWSIVRPDRALSKCTKSEGPVLPEA